MVDNSTTNLGSMQGMGVCSCTNCKSSCKGMCGDACNCSCCANNSCKKSCCKSCECSCNNKNLSKAAMAFAFGILWATYLFIMALLADFFGMGVFVVKFLGNFYIGYAPGLIGGVKGFIFGLIDGFICGFILAFFYNMSLTLKNRICCACKIGRCCKGCPKKP